MQTLKRPIVKLAQPPPQDYESSTMNTVLQMGLPLALLGGGVLAGGAWKGLKGIGKKLSKVPAARVEAQLAARAAQQSKGRLSSFIEKRLEGMSAADRGAALEGLQKLSPEKLQAMAKVSPEQAVELQKRIRGALPGMPSEAALAREAWEKALPGGAAKAPTSRASEIFAPAAAAGPTAKGVISKGRGGLPWEALRRWRKKPLGTPPGDILASLERGERAAVAKVKARQQAIPTPTAAAAPVPSRFQQLMKGGPAAKPVAPAMPSPELQRLARPSPVQPPPTPAAAKLKAFPGGPLATPSSRMQPFGTQGMRPGPPPAAAMKGQKTQTMKPPQMSTTMIKKQGPVLRRPVLVKEALSFGGVTRQLRGLGDWVKSFAPGGGKMVRRMSPSERAGLMARLEQRAQMGPSARGAYGAAPRSIPQPPGAPSAPAPGPKVPRFGDVKRVVPSMQERAGDITSNLRAGAAAPPAAASAWGAPTGPLPTGGAGGATKNLARPRLAQTLAQTGYGKPAQTAVLGAKTQQIPMAKTVVEKFSMPLLKMPKIPTVARPPVKMPKVQTGPPPAPPSASPVQMASPTAKIQPMPPAMQTQQMTSNLPSTPSKSALAPKVAQVDDLQDLLAMSTLWASQARDLKKPKIKKVAEYFGGGMGALDTTDTTLASEPVPHHAQLGHEPNPLMAEDLPQPTPEEDLMEMGRALNAPRPRIAKPDPVPYINQMLHDVFLQHASPEEDHSAPMPAEEEAVADQPFPPAEQAVPAAPPGGQLVAQ